MRELNLLENYLVLRRELGLIFACELKSSGLGRQQAQILFCLLESPRSMSELSIYTQADPAATTRTVSGLEKSGLVKRTADNRDGRRSIIQLTPKGKAQADIAHKIRKRIDSMLKAVLDKSEYGDLSRLLDKVAAGLKQKRAG